VTDLVPISVWIPGLAEDEFDGTEIGQRVAFGDLDSLEGEDRRVGLAWLNRTSRRAGKGTTVNIIADAEVLDYFRDVFGGLELACEQGEIPAAARACRTAIERIDKAVGR
jgi:hypothetical protein